MGILKVGAMSYAKMLRAICIRPLTYQEIADEVGLHYCTVRVYMNELRAQRVIYIHEWVKTKGSHHIVAKFKVNPYLRNEDAPRPPPMSLAERTAAYRERKKLKENPFHHLVNQVAA